VIPKNLKGLSSTNEEIELWPLWNRRQSTKFNGVSYVVQRGAEAVYSLEGKKEVRGLIDFYMENAKIMKNKLQTSGYKVYGGDNAPYIWIKVPEKMTSWDFFDFLLQKLVLWAHLGVDLDCQERVIFVCRHLTRELTSLMQWKE